MGGLSASGTARGRTKAALPGRPLTAEERMMQGVPEFEHAFQYEKYLHDVTGAYVTMDSRTMTHKEMHKLSQEIVEARLATGSIGWEGITIRPATTGEIASGTTLATFNRQSNTIAYRPDKLFSSGPNCVKAGWWASESVVQHELGHALHANRMPDAYSRGWRRAGSGWTGVKAPAAASQVSKYAEANVHEFVAETFAGMLVGKTYSGEVMNAYYKAGGASVKH